MNYINGEGVTSDVKPKVGKSKSSWIKTVVGIMVICFAVFNVVNYFSDPQREIEKKAKELLSQAEQQVDDGDYDGALDTLNRIDTDWDDYETVEDVRQEALKRQLKAKLVEYETVGNYQGIISLINEKVKDINSDKEVKVIYENSVQNYMAEAISSAEEYVVAGDYASARSALSIAKNFIGETEKISEKLKEINQKEVLEAVLSFEAEGNYKEAIAYLKENNSIVSDSVDLQTKFSVYTEKYRTNVISEAASEYKEKGYESAVSLLNSALDILKDDNLLISEKEKYEALKPIMLTEMEIFSYGYNGEYNVSLDNHTEDRYGNTYSTSFSIDDEDSIKWLLNGKYERITGTIACPKGYLLKSNYSNVIVTIYCDGNKVFKSDEAGPEKKPQSFSIDLTGIEELEIRWSCLDSWNIWKDWCVYGTIFDGALYPNS